MGTTAECVATPEPQPDLEGVRAWVRTTLMTRPAGVPLALELGIARLEVEPTGEVFARGRMEEFPAPLYRHQAVTTAAAFLALVDLLEDAE